MSDLGNCAQCGAAKERRVFPSGKTEGRIQAIGRRYCSHACYVAAKVAGGGHGTRAKAQSGCDCGPCRDARERRRAQKRALYRAKTQGQSPGPRRASTRPCSQCGEPTTNDQFCSRACFHESNRGKPSKLLGTPRGKTAHPEPELLEKACIICGATMSRRRDERGVIDRADTFQKKSTCSEDCRRKLLVQNNHWHTNPHAPAGRTLLARTCLDCGELRPGSNFVFHNECRAYVCNACRGSAYREARSEEQWMRDLGRRHERNVFNLEEATHYGEQWTGPQLEIALRDDIPVADIARILGRTYCAVLDARQRATHDPKWMRVAGAARV